MSTVKLHHVFTASPAKIYKAFLDADALAKWLPPYGFTCKVHSIEAREGGSYRMSFTNFTSGKSHSFGGKYLELKPNEYIKYSDAFEDPNMPGEMITTISIKEVSCGSEVNIEQTGIPEAIPPEMCYLGWQESIDQLGKVVNPNIPD